MGNNIWCEDGKYITPCKIQEPIQLTPQTIHYENLFGQIDMSSRSHLGKRARTVYIPDDQGDPQPQVSLKVTRSHCPLQLIQNPTDIISRKKKYVVSTEQAIKKTYSQNPLCKPKESYDSLSQYDTQNISPVKDQSEKDSISRIRIFSSRHQSQYFKIQ